MKILIIGNEGYVGPLVTERFKKSYNDIWLAGFDTGYFAHNITYQEFPERCIDVQYRGDVRQFPTKLLDGFDVIIYLAAISNDPMGAEFEEVTFEVNYRSAVTIAKAAKNAGVHHFVYASSCSVYGTADDKPRAEGAALNPLTAYAKSKVRTEKDLEHLSSGDFIITCLRFATACGFSPRLRLDLVLNDFVASAVSARKIEILSDGTPWRPLIHVNDMARAIDWASMRTGDNGGSFLIVNTGSNDWNYQIIELAKAVQHQINDVDIHVNNNSESDKRSYQIDFSVYKKLSGDYYPIVTIDKTIIDLLDGLNNISFDDAKFRTSNLIRLHSLKGHVAKGRLDKSLKWT